MNRAASFRQVDLARVIKGARAAGLEVERLEIEIDPDSGKITMRMASSATAAPSNDFDRLLEAGKG
jgi:hypothetical protein